MYKKILMILDLLGVSNDPPQQVTVPAIAARSQLEDDNNDDGVDDSHDVESCVELSKTSCKCSLCQIMYITLILLYFSHDLPNATKSLLTSPDFQIVIAHSISYRIPSNFVDSLIYTCNRCYYILTTQINLFEFPNFTPPARNPQMIECTVNEQ